MSLCSPTQIIYITQGSHLFSKQRGHHGSTQSSQKLVYKPACVIIHDCTVYKLQLVDQSKPCTEIYLQIIVSCINLQLAI